MGTVTETLKYKKIKYALSGLDEMLSWLDDKHNWGEIIKIDNYKDDTMLSEKVEFTGNINGKQRTICLKLRCTAKEMREIAKGKGIHEISYYKYSHLIKQIKTER